MLKNSALRLGLLICLPYLSWETLPMLAETKSTQSISSEQTSSFYPNTEVRRTSIDTTAQNVTAVSQLSDVLPTDWAFTSLQSLVERYGCIAGYPDRTFRGRQSTSRFEFATGLNACLDKINEILSAGLANKVNK